MEYINELIKSEPYKSCYEYGELVGIKQGRADAIDEYCKQISERVKYWDNCAKAVEKGSNEHKIFISLAKNFDELQEQLESLKEKKDE